VGAFNIESLGETKLKNLWKKYSWGTQSNLKASSFSKSSIQWIERFFYGELSVRAITTWSCFKRDAFNETYTRTFETASPCCILLFLQTWFQPFV